MDFAFTVDGELYKLAVESEEGVYVVRCGDSVWTVDFRKISPTLFSLRIGSRMHRVHLVENEGRRYLSVEGHRFCVDRHEVSRRKTAELREVRESAAICPPMPGMVVKINVSEGDTVRRNQSLAIVEAMKMENELRSPIDGRVRRIHASAGDLVDTGNPIIELEAV
jgi:biotin carboxyl carrier protein